MSYELEIDGTRQTLDDWGISQLTVTKAALMGDRMSFEVPCTLAVDAAIAARGSLVKLFSPDGVCRFIGELREPKPVIATGEQRRIYTVEGPWWWLQRVTYKQPWRFPAEVPTDYIGPETEMNEEQVGLVTLFRQYEVTPGSEGNPAVIDASKIDLSEQIGDALEQAVDYFGGLVPPIELDYDLGHVPSDTNPFTVQTNVEPPEDEKKDLSVLDVLEVALRWVPYVTARWDYYSGTPKLMFSAAQAMDSAGALIPGGRVDGDGFTVRNAAVTDLVRDVDLEPLDDRMAGTVKLNYLITNVLPDDVIYRSTESDTSTVDNGSKAEMEITVELRGAMWNGESYDDPEPRPPAGLARAMHQAFARLWWKFDLQFASQHPRWDLKIGEGWNISGVGSGPDSAMAVAQRIVFDVRMGITRVECGAPTHLGQGELLDLLMANRLRRPSQTADEQQWGFDGKEKDGEETGGGGIRGDNDFGAIVAGVYREYRIASELLPLP